MSPVKIEKSPLMTQRQCRLVLPSVILTPGIEHGRAEKFLGDIYCQSEEVLTFLKGGVVLHVITSLGSGGAEQMLTRLVLANRSSFRQVVVSLLDGGIYVSKLRNAGIEVHTLNLNGFYRLPAAFFSLVQLLWRIRPDVVMTWLYHADFLGTFAAIGSGLGAKRVIWNIRCSNIDFGNHARATRWVVRVLSWLSPLPKAVSTNSRAGQRAHHALGYRPRHWAVLPNGLDSNEYRPNERDRIEVRTELGIQPTEFAIGMVARLDPQKDHANFLAAADIVARSYPQARFILVGRGTNTLPARGGVLMLGERHDIPRMLRGLDLMVLSSAYGEGFPNILAEAMATGIPCVATNVGDAAAIVEEFGFVVPPRNASALATAITTILSEPPEIRAFRGKRARQKVERSYSMKSAIRAYRQLCQLVRSKTI
jgi:glycosyltransferase involved in cell wall biosynthesis